MKLTPLIKFIAALFVYCVVIVYLVFYSQQLLSVTLLGIFVATFGLSKLTSLGGLSNTKLMILLMVIIIFFMVYYNTFIINKEALTSNTEVNICNIDLNTNNTVSQTFTWNNPMTISFKMKLDNTKWKSGDCNSNIFEITDSQKKMLYGFHLAVPNNNGKCETPANNQIQTPTYLKQPTDWIPAHHQIQNDDGNMIDVNFGDGNEHTFTIVISNDIDNKTPRILQYNNAKPKEYGVINSYLDNRLLQNPIYLKTAPSLKTKTVNINFGSNLPVTLAEFKIEKTANYPKQ